MVDLSNTIHMPVKKFFHEIEFLSVIVKFQTVSQPSAFRKIHGSVTNTSKIFIFLSFRGYCDGWMIPVPLVYSIAVPWRFLRVASLRQLISTTSGSLLVEEDLNHKSQAKASRWCAETSDIAHLLHYAPLLKRFCSTTVTGFPRPDWQHG